MLARSQLPAIGRALSRRLSTAVVTIPAPPKTLALLTRLHDISEAQETDPNFHMRAHAPDTAEFKTTVSDKLIALDRDKAAFMHMLARSTGATRIVEAGTSFGVSTIYLALAAAANAAEQNSTPVVIGTEHEDTKAKQARAHFAEAGVEGSIDLRVGDLRETLARDMGRVDLLLLDIWTPMALPALKLCEPHFRPGAIILCDNPITSRDGYQELFEHLDAHGSGYSRLTIPYGPGGLEMITYHSA